MEKKKSSRGVSQDESKVAGEPDYAVKYESKNSTASTGEVIKPAKSAGNSGKKVEGKSGSKSGKKKN